MIQPKSIGILGGRGRMGKLIQRILVEAGYEVHIFGSSDKPVSEAFVSRNEVLILAVPITALESVLREIGPVTREDGAVIDISSLKEGPVRWMRTHCRGEVIGSHPLFGPHTLSLEGQIVFLCPPQAGRWKKWFQTFLEESGAIVVEIEPAEHDRLMAFVQTLRHFALFSLGLTLRKLDFDFNSDLTVSGPWFRRLIDMLARQLQQPVKLYADLALGNSMSARVLGVFSDVVMEFQRAIGAQDREKLLTMMEEISDYIGRTIGLPESPPPARGGNSGTSMDTARPQDDKDASD